MASKNATRAQTAEKTSFSSKPTLTSNPWSNTLSDQHNMVTETTTNDVLAKNYNNT